MKNRSMLGVVLSAFTFALISACGGGGGGGGNTSAAGDAPSIAALTSALLESDPDCPSGGVLLKTGIDENGNGVLDDPAEVDNTQKICNGAPGATGPGMPVIQSLHLTGAPANPGATVTATAIAQSPEGLSLSYAWSVSDGWSIVGAANGGSVTLQAPAVYGHSATLTVTITDSNFRQAIGTWALSTVGNLAPVVHSITGGSLPFKRNTSVLLDVSASDPNGDALTYTWTVPSGFTIQSGQGTSQISLTASQFGSGLVEVSVEDGSSSATARIYASTYDGEWHTASRIQIESGVGTATPQVALDASGNAVAVWQQGIYGTSAQGLSTSRYVPGSGWSRAEVISSSLTAWLAPQVAMNAAGNTAAIWLQSDGTRTNVWASHYVPGGWGMPQLLETDNAGDAQNPQIAVDANGNALAVWQQSDGTRTNIWANRYVAGSGWGTAELIETDNAGSAAFPQVVQDATGNAMAVWNQSDGARGNIWANRFVAGSGWGTAQLIETDVGGASLPQVALDAAGNAVAVWHQMDNTLLNGNWRTNIWANHYAPGSGWGTAQLIETYDDVHALDPQIAMNAAGEAMAVWRQSDGTRTNVWARRYAAGSGWGTAQLIETDNASDAHSLQVALDGSGNAMAVWAQHDGKRNNIWANRYVAGSGWGGAQLLETDNFDHAYDPQVAMNANGMAVAVWRQPVDAFMGTLIFANVFD